MKPLKFVWVNGQLDYSPVLSHIGILKRLGYDPHATEISDLAMGTYSPVTDLISVDYTLGHPPTAQELEFWLAMDMDRYGATHESASVEDTEPEYNFGFLDDPHPTLYPCAWDNMHMRTDAKKAIKAHAMQAIEGPGGLADAAQWIYFTVYGSGASYNWDETGDFDVQMWVDLDKYNEQHADAPLTSDELLAMCRRAVQAVNFPSFADLGLQDRECEGKMLIQYYPKAGKGTPEENEAQKPYACYDLETDEWIVRPEPITADFYGQHFVVVSSKANDIADQAGQLVAQYQKNILNWQFWTSLNSKYGNPLYKKEADKSKINATIEQQGIAVLFHGVFGGRQEAYSPEGEGINDERDAVQKLLEVWGVFQELKHFARVPLPWDTQEVPAEPQKESAVDIKKMQEIAERYKPDGGYGETLYNPDIKTVLWIPADWTEIEEEEAAHKEFLALEDVDKVEGDAEQGLPWQENEDKTLKKPMQLEEPWVRIATNAEALNEWIAEHGPLFYHLDRSDWRGKDSQDHLPSFLRNGLMPNHKNITWLGSGGLYEGSDFSNPSPPQYTVDVRGLDLSKILSFDTDSWVWGTPFASLGYDGPIPPESIRINPQTKSDLQPYASVWKESVEYDPEFYEHHKDIPSSGCFGYVNGNLILGHSHHQLIMGALLDKGWTWDDLMNAPQAWGWFSVDSDYNDDGEFRKIILMRFTSDAGFQNEDEVERAKGAFAQMYHLPVKVYDQTRGVSEEGYGTGLSGTKQHAENYLKNPDAYFKSIYHTPYPPANEKSPTWNVDYQITDTGETGKMQIPAYNAEAAMKEVQDRFLPREVEVWIEHGQNV